MKPDPRKLPPELASVVIDGRYLGDRYPGIARYVFNLVRAMIEVAPVLPVTLLVDPKERQTRFDVEGLRARGVKLKPVKAPLRSLRGYFAGRHVGGDRAAGVFHAPHIFSALPTTRRSVVTIHDLIPTHPEARLRRRRDRTVYRIVLRRALASAGGILTPSPVVAEELQRAWGVPAERIAVTPYAADPRFGPRSPASAAAGPPLASPGGDASAGSRLPAAYALYVGTGRPHKNLPLLLRAWSLLDRHARRGCSLVIAGPTALGEPGGEAAARTESGVVFLGAVDEAELPDIYRGARMLVHPALHEGFGLTVVEAMACGVPVACSSSASLNSVCGGAAVRFDARDPEAIAAAIGNLLSDEAERARLIAAGAERAAQFSWSRTAELTLGAYVRAARHPAAASSA